MRIHDAGSGVTIVELDPTKTFWVVLDRDSGIDPETIRMYGNEKGLIVMRNNGDKIEFVENIEGLDVERIVKRKPEEAIRT